MTTKANALARKKAIESKLEDLKAMQAQLKAERDKAAKIIKSTEATSRRKARNRALTLLGLLIETELKSGAQIQPLLDRASTLKPAEVEFLTTWLNNNFSLEQPR